MWIQANGETNSDSMSNLAPEDAQRGPIIETSFQGEVRGDQFIQGGPSSYQAGAHSDAPAGSVMETLRDEGNGTIMARAVKLSDTVEVQGMRTSIANALALGVIERTETGGFRDATAAPEEATEKAPEGKAEAAFNIGEAGEAAMSELVGNIDQGGVMSAMDQLLAGVDVSDNTVGRLATAAGVEPEQMRETINTVHTATYDAAMTRLEAQGLSEEGLSAFAEADPTAFRMMQDAARDLLTTNDTAGLDALAETYTAALDRFQTAEVMGALTEAGYGYQPDGRGGLIVVLNDGTEVPWSVAVRQGIIKLSA
ncbi:hypothetical protein J7426_18560 [Tropicibacter sp. R16_0]|uniref:hypothetical protein n=1 Tax=Tropicibacter sp. R16_0 TaxID=2821102 RepID=UPI001ADD16F2|nr:hypothetical protein [Tropicibacter sp. R16_0]MBO9452282.1 hypothetical protein [Tropicibacter sp. R16_0]